MNYLSIDIEATGLRENDIIIEFGMVPVSTEQNKVCQELSYHSYIKCPSFLELKPRLDNWVIDNNKDLIDKAHQNGQTIESFKTDLIKYFEKQEVQKFFNFPNEKIILLGKSLNAIDLPFLNRDLGWNFMRKYFSHQVLDVSSIVMSQIDKGTLPIDCMSGSKLSSYLKLGDVEHTALEDAIKMAQIYLNLLDFSRHS